MVQRDRIDGPRLYASARRKTGSRSRRRHHNHRIRKVSLLSSTSPNIFGIMSHNQSSLHRARRRFSSQQRAHTGARASARRLRSVSVIIFGPELALSLVLVLVSFISEAPLGELYFKLGIFDGSPGASDPVGTRFGLACALPPATSSNRLSVPAPISGHNPTRSPSPAPNARSSFINVADPRASLGSAAIRWSSRTSHVPHGRLESSASVRRQRADRAARHGVS